MAIWCIIRKVEKSRNPKFGSFITQVSWAIGQNSNAVFSLQIGDFGLSNVFDLRNTLNTFCGSALYASPEIVSNALWIIFGVQNLNAKHAHQLIKTPTNRTIHPGQRHAVLWSRGGLLESRSITVSVENSWPASQIAWQISVIPNISP